MSVNVRTCVVLYFVIQGKRNDMFIISILQSAYTVAGFDQINSLCILCIHFKWIGSMSQLWMCKYGISCGCLLSITGRSIFVAAFRKRTYARSPKIITSVAPVPPSDTQMVVDRTMVYTTSGYLSEPPFADMVWLRLRHGYVISNFLYGM